jgi:hypothetical protein
LRVEGGIIQVLEDGVGAQQYSPVKFCRYSVVSAGLAEG